MKDYFKRNGMLIKNLVIPLVALSVLTFFLAGFIYRDVFVNLATGFISIIFTVFYVDLILKHHEKTQWSIPDLYLRNEVGVFGHGIIGELIDVLNLNKQLFPEADLHKFSLKEFQAGIIERTRMLPRESIERSLALFDVVMWRKLSDIITQKHESAFSLMGIFATRLSPDEFEALLKFREVCSTVLSTYSLFKIMLGMPKEKIPVSKTGDSSVYALLVTKRISIDLKRLLDSSINLIEVFNYAASEPEVDYNQELTKAW